MNSPVLQLLNIERTYKQGDRILSVLRGASRCAPNFEERCDDGRDGYEANDRVLADGPIRADRLQYKCAGIVPEGMCSYWRSRSDRAATQRYPTCWIRI